jgi:16S rRNA (guanine966-N2)-methyltransferase
VRIVAGAFRGRRLAALGRGDAAAALRPTPDRVREALFSILGARMEFEGAQVLDLFAGTGALGLEALSRGAAAAVFVESGRVGQRLISENIAALGVARPARLIRGDATRLGPAPSEAPFDLVFLDPPYGRGLGARALLAARAQGWLADAAWVAWEEAGPQDPPEGFALADRRRYGDTHLTLLVTGKGEDLAT